ncbi:MAG TPA: DUF3592 domain-containing protein [Acidobacteriaceae bacterium]|jgi:hypothetical protein|nr:DUF3592 domain-containing protein [Acidobacteriaceae bacterium]
MLPPSLRDAHVIGTVAAVVLCVGGVATYLVLRRRPTPEEIERERRAELVRSGRIMDGTILDISEFEAVPAADRRAEIHFILYKYEIGGVAYECSQDVSALRDLVNPAELRLGFPCSVRYDIHRPENSIVVAENWSGLRNTAQSVPTRPPAGRKSRNSAPAQSTRPGQTI